MGFRGPASTRTSRYGCDGFREAIGPRGRLGRVASAVQRPGAQAGSKGLAPGDRTRSWMIPKGLFRPSERSVWPRPGTSHTQAPVAGKPAVDTSSPLSPDRQRTRLLAPPQGGWGPEGGTRPGAGSPRPGSAARSGWTRDGTPTSGAFLGPVMDRRASPPTAAAEAEDPGPHREAPGTPALGQPAAGPRRPGEAWSWTGRSWCLVALRCCPSHLFLSFRKMSLIYKQ